jgi:hypothetical protein
VFQQPHPLLCELTVSKPHTSQVVFTQFGTTPALPPADLLQVAKRSEILSLSSAQRWAEISPLEVQILLEIRIIKLIIGLLNRAQ